MIAPPPSRIMPHASPTPNWPALILLFIAAGLRFWNLGGPSFWYDEAYSWWVGTQISPAASIASSLAEFIPPGAYFLWRAWGAVAGPSEFALRTLSALSGIITVAATARAATRLAGGGRGPGRGGAPPPPPRGGGGPPRARLPPRAPPPPGLLPVGGAPPRGGRVAPPTPA